MQYYDNRDNEKIKRRIPKNKRDKSIVPYIVVGAVALIVFIASYIYLLYVLSQSPESYYETSMIFSGFYLK